jgi:predicted dithiol-disulfide oxidoreductase (DUF899 family)
MIGTREEWLAARRELLDKEKELTRRAPLERLLAYRERKGWSFPWVSSPGDFNLDFSLFTDEERRSGGAVYHATRPTTGAPTC